MDTTLSPATGQLLDGRYQVDSRLANGGMATVYLGRDTRLDRTVALKIAHPELASDQEFVRRFITEARAVAQLSSPNVVAIYDQGSAGDVNYIVMEYVAGPTLREVLNARGALSVRESLDVVEGVLAGLATAHRVGIIHRDVKPENVLLGAGGVVKVADFGLARAAAAAGRTKTGMLIGTAAYLAPEQVASSTSDARTDVYAAGVLLFEMLTGAQPHTGESPLAVAYKHVSDVVPPPSSLVAGLPPALDALVALATSRDPELRPPDAGQFLHAITEVRHGAPLSSARHAQHAAPWPPAGAFGQPGPAAPDAAAGATAGAVDESLADTDLGPAISAAGPGEPMSSGAIGGGATGGGAIGSGAAAAGVMAAGAAVAAATPVGAYDLARGPDGSGPNGLAARHALPGGTPGGGTDAAGDLLPWTGEQEDPHGAANHTLVVSAGTIVPGFGGPADFDHGRQRRGYRPDGEPPLQRLLFSRRLIYVLVALAVVLIAVLLGWWLTAGQYTQVPQVSGWSSSLARTELTGLGFQVHDGPGRHSDQQAGHVVGISPRAGAKARTGATITLTLSLGPVRIQVPSVTGMQVAQAQQQLQSAGLTAATPKQAPSATIAAGVVISTNPVAGTPWPKDKPVGITVSAGPPLPNFVGGQVSAAQAAAQSGGYQINPVQDAKSDQPSGTVTRQSPAAGTAIHSGEVVQVYVSPGPPQVSVPDVQGMRVQQAEQALQRAGFKVAVDKIGPGHTVFSYNPQGQATTGSTVTIDVGFSFL